MTSTASNNVRISALEKDIREVKSDIAGIASNITALTSFLTEGKQQPAKATTAKASTKAAKAPKKGKKAKASAPTTGSTFAEQRLALRALKAEGKAPAGMTVKEAVTAGLLGETAQPERKTEAPKAKGKQAKAEVKAKSEAYGAYSKLREALKVHKASGAVPKEHNGTFVTVKSAIADGLMNEDGTVGKAKAAKAGKKGKKAKVTAEVTDAAPAVLRATDGPRRANGSVTPKREWGLRETLADTGKYDRNEIDAKVAEAVAAGLI